MGVESPHQRPHERIVFFDEVGLAHHDHAVGREPIENRLGNDFEVERDRVPLDHRGQLLARQLGPAAGLECGQPDRAHQGDRAHGASLEPREAVHSATWRREGAGCPTRTIPRTTVRDRSP